MADDDFPEHWEADVVLRDGRTARVRPPRPADRDMLVPFYQNLSEQSLYTRFFSASPELVNRDMERVLAADHNQHLALVAIAGDRIIGVATCDSIGRAEGEIAFIVADDQQGRGLGSVLLEHLAAIARETGVHRFKAEVLSSNKRMLATFEAAGYAPSTELADGIYQLDFEIDPTHKSRSVVRAREHRAESLSIRRLLRPATVAIIVDDVEDGCVGEQLVANLVSGGFGGQVVVISPGGSSVDGVPGAKSLHDVSFTVETAVIAMSPDHVEAVIDDCAACGVHGIVLTTGGFIEDHDYSRQRALTRRIRLAGMRLVGPAALGVINTDPAVKLNASLVPQMPGRGRTGFFSQTGAFGTAILADARRRGLGVSTFVSAGNRADVSTNDLLQYWEDDDATSLVLLYLESIGNPRKFTRIARRLSRRKPVVAVRSGRSTQSLPLGHNVRGTELPPDAIEAIFEQAGVIQVDTYSELLEIAALLAFQPLPTGNRVGFITDSDAVGVLAIDASTSLGLAPTGPARIADPTIDPIDFERAFAQMSSDPAVDSIVVSHVPSAVTRSTAFEEIMTRLAHESTKPILGVMMAGNSEPLVGALSHYGMPGHGSVPVFANMEDALRALRCVVNYQEWLVAPRGRIPSWKGLERQRAHKLAVDSIEQSEAAYTGSRLTADVIVDILDSYDIDVWPMIPVDSEDSAVAAAHAVGFPVVMKSMAERFAHRVDMGGVHLSLVNELAVRTAYLSMAATLPPEALAKLVVQRMAPPGVACVVATTEDPLFGPIVSFRLAGHLPLLLNDIAYRIPPITDQDAKRVIRRPRGAPLLFQSTLPELAGDQELDIGALEDLVARVGQLADDVPEIASLELNPIIVHAHGVCVLGATGRVARPLARTDLEARRLL